MKMSLVAIDKFSPETLKMFKEYDDKLKEKLPVITQFKFPHNIDPEIVKFDLCHSCLCIECKKIRDSEMIILKLEIEDLKNELNEIRSEIRSMKK
jgi:hypothetical protein